MLTVLLLKILFQWFVLVVGVVGAIIYFIMAFTWKDGHGDGDHAGHGH